MPIQRKITSTIFSQVLKFMICDMGIIMTKGLGHGLLNAKLIKHRSQRKKLIALANPISKSGGILSYDNCRVTHVLPPLYPSLSGG